MPCCLALCQGSPGRAPSRLVTVMRLRWARCRHLSEQNRESDRRGRYDRPRCLHSLARDDQQAVDQLQVVQDQLVAQQTETKKLSEQITTLTVRLDALHSATTGQQAKPR